MIPRFRLNKTTQLEPDYFEHHEACMTHEDQEAFCTCEEIRYSIESNMGMDSYHEDCEREKIR